MANPTSNFNWQMPTASDLVTDLPADFEVFGQAVDTSLADLKGGTTDQVLAKNSNTDMDFKWVTSDDANAIQNSIVDAKGDLIAASANDTPARLAVGANGETLVADSSTSTGLRYNANFAAGKNAIINGDFGVWQRGAGAFTGLTGTYSSDRWTFYGQGSGVSHSATRETFTPATAPVAGYEGTFFYRDVITSGADAATQMIVIQKIEDVRKFAGQTVTVSFWAKANTGTPKVGMEFYQDFGSGGSGAVSGTGQSVTISTSWARYSATFSVPSISGKTVGTGSSLFLNLWLSAGSSSATRSGTVGLQSATFDIWGVQVEAGSVATAFQTATGTIQGELGACQRYYWRVTADSTNTAAKFGVGSPQNTTTGYASAVNPVPMRVPATSIDFANLAWMNFGLTSYAASGLVIAGGSQSTTNSFFQFTGSGLTAGQFGWVQSNSSSSGYLGFSAEL
jgi:hypothetical protein